MKGPPTARPTSQIGNTLTTATQTLTAAEIEDLKNAIGNLPLPGEGTLHEEWTLYDVSWHGIAQRLLELADPLFENEGNDKSDFVFLPNPSVSLDEFSGALVLVGLPRVLTLMTDLESLVAAEKHARGYTELGWPLRPQRADAAQGLIRNDGTVIDSVLPEEEARAPYLTALDHAMAYDSVECVIRDFLIMELTDLA